MEVPNISVIIPLYNAKEYIGKCLDSLLSQTFQNFEVIVVNDCSTDKSADIVESFKEKFGERLKLTNTEKNSGGCGFVPRNVGLGLASGEYVFFVDADDYLAENALTILYTAAKENEAEVVYTATCYYLRNAKNFKIIKDSKGHELQKKDEELKPTLIVNEPDKNINRLFSGEDFRTAWTKFVQRDFLVKNKILFPEITTGGDYIWSMNIFCHASRVLRLFVPVYFRRSYSPGLVERKALRPSSKIYFWVSAFVAWLKALNRLANKNEILRKDSAQYYRVSSDYFKYCLEQISDEVLNRFYSKDTHEILFREFLKRKDSSYLTVPFLFSAIANREKHINKSQKQLDQLTVDVDRQQKKINSMESRLRPLVSIIIPMYNAEKFIGEALDSLLAQTLENFEVLVVDDCSKDNSYKVVEKYIPKFEGRLILTKTKKNSGSGGLPRNKGVALSRGEYIYFVDADDALIKTALEEMYNLAKKFNADVVYCEKYFMSSGIGADFIKKIYPAVGKIQDPPFVDEPTLETKDLAKRIQKLTNHNYWMTTWLRLVRRNLLIENGITFSLAIYSEDAMWTYQVLFCAERFLRIPGAYYIRRMHNSSLTTRKYTAKDHMYNWMSVIILSLKNFDDFIGKIDFFKKNPNYRYEILDHFFQSNCLTSLKACKNLSPADVYNLFLQNFGKYLGNYDTLISCFYARVYSQSKYWNEKYHTLKMDTQRRIDELEKEIRQLKRDYELVKNNNLPQSEFPAISVIIPMYNAEKYIGECLQSLLIQTFQNFEVIVVNDCSTDNSVKVVNSYAPKFDGLLKLANTEKNSSSGGSVPRNIGLKLSRGEYVFFMDADDFILGNALETFYTAAKESEADIVYASAYYLLYSPNGARILRDGIGTKLYEEGLEDNSTLTIDNPCKNLEQLVFERGFNFPWTQFVRRELLVKNEIRFPEILNGVDHLWVIQVYCYAKRFLRISSPLYFYRRHNTESISMKKRPPQEQLSYWISTFITWLKTLNELANKIEILRDNPSYCFEAAKRHFEWCLNRTGKARKELNNQEIYEILYSEFSKGNISSDLTVPFFFSFINMETKTKAEQVKTIDTLKKEIEQVQEIGGSLSSANTVEE